MCIIMSLCFLLFAHLKGLRQTQLLLLIETKRNGTEQNEHLQKYRANVLRFLRVTKPKTFCYLQKMVCADKTFAQMF